MVEAIAGDIINGTLSGGDMLDVDDVGHRFDVSRTVVREALKVLAAKGMVGAKQNRGTFVRPREEWALLDPDVLRWQSASQVTETTLRSLHELRLLIEPAAARLAAERADAEDLEALERALDDFAAAVQDPSRAGEADVAFHGLVLRATKNELLLQLRSVLGAPMRWRDEQVVARVTDDPVPSHRAVLEAIAAGDPRAAENAMREVVMRAASDQERAMGAVPSDGEEPHG